MDNNQPPPTAAQSSSYPPQPPYHHHHLHLQQQQQQLQTFWTYQRQEIEQVIDFKNHQLPLARIKKIMKADEDVRMISAEAPMLFSKACELFILELTIRSWIHAEENKRRTLQNNDIATAITRPDIFDFLVDIVPREIKEEGVEIVGSTATGVRTIILRRRRVGLIRGCTCRRRRRGNRCGRRRRRIGRMVAEGAVGRSIWMGKVNLLSCRCYVDDAEWHNGRLLSLFLLSGIL